jgi:hypothetical protein
VYKATSYVSPDSFHLRAARYGGQVARRRT